MYGPEAKTITRRVKLESAVGRKDMIGKNYVSPRIFLVPVPMPNSVEQYVWFDLTYPIRAIYLPRQHRVDNNAYKEWCVFQHLAVRLRTLEFNAYVRSGEVEVTAEEREKFTVTIDGGTYSSGDQYLLGVIESRSSQENKDKPPASGKTISELKELQENKDPSLRKQLENKLAELCEIPLYTSNKVNKEWAKDYEEIQKSYKALKDDTDAEVAKVWKGLKQIFPGGKGKYQNVKDVVGFMTTLLKTREKALQKKPHGEPLKPEDEKRVQENHTLWVKAMESARTVDREMAEAKRTRLRRNTYQRKSITFDRNDELGWGIRAGWIARFDVGLIYSSTMIPRGWLLPEFQSTYCGVDIFDEKSIIGPFPQEHDFEVTIMNDEDHSIDIKEMLNKEWGVRLKYDDTPVEPDFIWGLVNSIAQIGLGLVPGWGPLLVYGDTVLWNLIFTDKFDKVAAGDKDSVTEFSLSTTGFLVGGGASLKGLVKSTQSSSVQTLIAHGVIR